MADLPISIPATLADDVARVLDVERKIPRAFDALAPLAERDVALVGGGPVRAGQLREFGARVTDVEDRSPDRLDLADASQDAVIGCWSAFRGVVRSVLDDVDRVLRPAGRLLVLHDYGRDDVSRLFGDRPEYGDWSRRTGPYLAGGFRIRVIHCWWTFEDLDAARRLLDAFGAEGTALAATLRRPRLSYNVAIYHRAKEAAAGAA